MRSHYNSKLFQTKNDDELNCFKQFKSLLDNSLSLDPLISELNPQETEQMLALMPALTKDLLALKNNTNQIAKNMYSLIKNRDADLSMSGFLNEIKLYCLDNKCAPYLPNTLEWFYRKPAADHTRKKFSPYQ